MKGLPCCEEGPPGLEGTVLDSLGDEEENDGHNDEDKQNGNVEFAPFFVRHAGHPQAAPHHSGGGPDIVGKAIAELVGQDGALLGDTQEGGQGGDDGEDGDGLPAGRANEEVEEGDRD